MAYCYYIQYAVVTFSGHVRPLRPLREPSRNSGPLPRPIGARIRFQRRLGTDRSCANHPPVSRIHWARVRSGSLGTSFLVSAWAKDLLSFGTHCINARSEIVATQPSFRGAFKARRCLVPVNAFYESSGLKGRQRKWRIRLKVEGILSLAGPWERWGIRRSVRVWRPTGGEARFHAMDVISP